MGKILLALTAVYILILCTAALEKNGVQTEFISDQRIHEFLQSSNTYEYIDLSGKRKIIQL
jgi:signal transduction histidine kinase